MVTEPEAVGVYVTEQLPPDRLQVVLPKIPLPVGHTEKLTVPVGVTVVPGPVSATLTVQVRAVPTPPEVGRHVTEVEVLRWVAVIDRLLELPECCPSPG